MGTESLGNGTAAATQDRFAGQVGYRGARREGAPLPGEAVEVELGPRNGVVPLMPAITPMTNVSLDGPRPSLADLDSLAEPVFPPAGWLEESTGSLADHPLLRGLLMELPPKGTAPAPGWLDRWFEAARSILELLYVQDAQRR